MSQFSTMTDEELLQFAYISPGILFSTALELELAKRLQVAVDEANESADLLEMLAERDIDGESTKTLEADLELLERLKTVLDEHELPEDADVLCSELTSLAAVREALTATVT